MDRNSKLKILSVVLLVTIVFLNSCLPEKEQAPYPYKIELNQLRKEVGLRLIDSTFYKDSYYFKSASTFDKVNKIYYDSYTKPKNRGKTPKTQSLFWEKHTKLDRYNGKPQYEEDIYRSGFYKYGYMEETDIFETLKLRYVFEDYKEFDIRTKDSLNISKGWQYIYEFPIEDKGVTSNKPKSEYWKKEEEKISEKKADSILESWKLKRLNY
ncbi:hypothetical protein [Lacinutrix undariae]